jgi:hypothetical protein
MENENDSKYQTPMSNFGASPSSMTTEKALRGFLLSSSQ